MEFAQRSIDRGIKRKYWAEMGKDCSELCFC